MLIKAKQDKKDKDRKILKRFWKKIQELKSKNPTMSNTNCEIQH